MPIRSSHMQDTISTLLIFRDTDDICDIAVVACGELLELFFKFGELVDAGEVDEVVDLFFLESWCHDCGLFYIWSFEWLWSGLIRREIEIISGSSDRK